MGGLQSPLPTPSSGGAELCQQMLCQTQTCQTLQGPGPKLCGISIMLGTHHTLTRPGLYWGFVLGALRDRVGNHPAMPMNSA